MVHLLLCHSSNGEHVVFLAIPSPTAVNGVFRLTYSLDVSCTKIVPTCLRRAGRFGESSLDHCPKVAHRAA
jgi:hypothetical protein